MIRNPNSVSSLLRQVHSKIFRQQKRFISGNSLVKKKKKAAEHCVVYRSFWFEKMYPQSYETRSYILSRFRGVTIDGVWIGEGIYRALTCCMN
jgi:hypothetical protein